MRGGSAGAGFLGSGRAGTESPVLPPRAHPKGPEAGWLVRRDPRSRPAAGTQLPRLERMSSADTSRSKWRPWAGAELGVAAVGQVREEARRGGTPREAWGWEHPWLQDLGRLEGL